MELTKKSLEYPQIDAAFRYMYDNPNTYRDRSGDIYEFGVYNGNSLYKICNYLRLNPHVIGKDVNVYGFDSFEGLPKEENGMPVFAKFGEGAYKAEKNDITIEIVAQSVYPNSYVIKSWFDKLAESRIKYFALKPAILVHIDCDLYISTKQALKFIYDNSLVSPGTLLAFDEFESVGCNGGEKKAFMEILEKYQYNAEEVWHFTYRDKHTNTPIRQSLWEVF